MGSSRPCEAIDAGLGKPQVAHLTRLDEFRHCPDSIFYRDIGIDAMLVIEVDMLDAQTRQRLIAAGFDVFGATARSHAPIIASQPELGCQDHTVAPVSDGAPDEAFIVSIAIDIGRIKKEYAQINSALDGGDGLLFVRRSV